MKQSAGSPLTDGSNHRKGLQAGGNDERPWLIRVLQDLWFAKLYKPICTIWNGYRQKTNRMMANVRPFIFSKWEGASIYKDLLKSTSITELGSKSRYKTHKVVATEARSRSTAPSAQAPNAEHTDHIFPELGPKTGDPNLVQQPLLSLFHGDKAVSEDDSIPSLKGAPTVNVHLSVPQDESSSVSLYQNNEAHLLMSLEAVRNSADHKCPLYYLSSTAPRVTSDSHQYDNTGLSGHQSYTDPQNPESAGLLVRMVNIVCPYSPFGKERSTLGQGLKPNLFPPIDFAYSLSSLSGRISIPFLQDIGSRPLSANFKLPITAEENDRHKRTELSDGDVDYVEPPPSEAAKSSAESSRQSSHTLPSQELKFLPTLPEDGYRRSGNSSPPSSSHTRDSSRGGSSLVNAPSSQTTAGDQSDLKHPSSRKRKRTNQQDRRGGTKREDRQSGEDSAEESDSPESGETKSKHGRAQRPLACPFNKYDPSKFCNQPNDFKYRTCTNSFSNTAVLIQHFKRCHKYDDLVCVRCTRQFLTRCRLTCHLRGEEDNNRENQRCVITPWRVIDQEKWLIRGCKRWRDLKQVGKKSIRDSAEKHWNQIFTAIFPEVSLLPSPYHGTSSESAEIADTRDSDLFGEVIPGELEAMPNRSDQPAMLDNVGTWSRHFNDQGSFGQLDMPAISSSRVNDSDMARSTTSLRTSLLPSRINWTHSTEQSSPFAQHVIASAVVAHPQANVPLIQYGESFNQRGHEQFRQIPQQQEHTQRRQCQQQQQHLSSTLANQSLYTSDWHSDEAPTNLQTPVSTAADGGRTLPYFRYTVQPPMHPDDLEDNDVHVLNQYNEYNVSNNVIPFPDLGSDDWHQEIYNLLQSQPSDDQQHHRLPDPDYQRHNHHHRQDGRYSH